MLSNASRICIYLCMLHYVTSYQRFLQQPQSTSVHKGDNTTLICSIQNREGELQWTKDDFGLGTDIKLKGYHRYHMTVQKFLGSESWNLVLSNIELEDEGQYQCQVGATEEEGR